MERLFVDTSAWFAYFNRKDPDHRSVTKVLEGFQGRLVTSNYVFDEVITLCLMRSGHADAVAVGEVLRDTVLTDLIRISPHDEEEAWRLFRARPDKTYSLTDCTSFALLRRLKLQAVASLDADFAREGFEVRP